MSANFEFDSGDIDWEATATSMVTAAIEAADRYDVLAGTDAARFAEAAISSLCQSPNTLRALAVYASLPDLNETGGQL